MKRASSPSCVYEDDLVTLHQGDCLDVLRTLPDDSVDAVVTDPPYGLEFMGKGWDGADGFRRSLNPADAGRDNVFGRTSRTGPEYRTGHSIEPFRSNDGYDRLAQPVRRGAPAESAPLYQQWCQAWAIECLRVLKPGGHLLAFGGTRTAHRLACAIEDAGFELRDTIAWLYGSGFPKSLDVSKAIDKAARGVPQGAADPTSPNHGKYRTTTTEGKRWDGDSGQGYGAGGSRFLADGMAGGSDTEPAASGVVATASDSVWQGWGTALKPANEPIVVARKPLAGTVAANVEQYGTGAFHIAACRTSWGADGDKSADRKAKGYTDAAKKALGGVVASESTTGFSGEVVGTDSTSGRWPTNVVLDPEAAEALDQQTGVTRSRIGAPRSGPNGDGWGMTATGTEYDDQGGASRFFPTFRYEAKAPTDERPKVGLVAHPTVKPLDLMRWLVRLVTPPSGVVLEPFAGSGTTAEACIVEGFRCIAIEREADYIPLILARITKPIEPVLFGESA